MKLLVIAFLTVSTTCMAAAQVHSSPIFTKVSRQPQPSTPSNNPPPSSGSAPVILTGKWAQQPLTNSWPDYPAVVIQTVPFSSSYPQNFPGLGPNKCWIPTSDFSIERDSSQQGIHFIAKFKVRQGPWADLLTESQAIGWPTRFQFHAQPQAGADTVVQSTGLLKSVKWSWQNGDQPGLYADVVFAVDNFWLQAP